MRDDATNASQIQLWVDRLKAGDPAARDELIACACNRLLALTRKIKRGFAEVGRWEQTEDVFQNATLRLCQALEKVELTDARHFLRLAAVQIRREMIDLAPLSRPAWHGGSSCNQCATARRRQPAGSALRTG